VVTEYWLEMCHLISTALLLLQWLVFFCVCKVFYVMYVSCGGVVCLRFDVRASVRTFKRS